MARLLTPCFDLGGFDGLTGVCGAGEGAAVPTFDSTVHRSGRRSLKCVNTGLGCYAHFTQGTALGNAFYFRGYLNIATTPTTADDCIQVAGAALAARVRLTTTRTLQLRDSAGTQIGADSAALNTGQWYRVELKVIVPASGSGTAELLLDGAVVATSAAASVQNTAISDVWVGAGLNNVNTGATVNWDDCAINDSTGTQQTGYPGYGRVVMLLPVSDNARTGYTNGAAGTTNLWDAVNNTPPVGVAAASSTATSQIKDTVANTTDNYVANLGAYTDALASGGGALQAGDTVALVQSVMNVGQAAATAQSFGQALTNPTVAESTASGVALTAGTFPTNWKTLFGTVTYAPTPTLGTQPTLKIRKNTAVTAANQADFMGLIVEYKTTPARTATEGPITVSDAATRTVGRARTATESVSVSDVATRGGVSQARTATESVSVSDAATATTAKARTATEPPVSVSDAAVGFKVALRTATEPAISVSDVASRSATSRARTASESVAVSDVAVRAAVSRARSASEPAVAVSDAAVAAVVKVYLPGQALWVREKMPLRLHCLVRTPGGVTNRWSPDAHERENALKALRFSTVMPGGMEAFNVELPRQVGQNYPDLVELADVSIQGVGGLSAGQFRLEKTPSTSQDAAARQPQGSGYQAALQDNKGALAIYVDRSFQDWVPASVQRKIDLLNEGWVSVNDPSSEADPTTGNPSEKLTVTGEWVQGIIAEGWYDARGVPLSKVFFSMYADPHLGNIPSDFKWGVNVGLASDDVASEFDSYGGIADTTALGGWVNAAAGARRPWAFIQLFNTLAPGGGSGVDYSAYFSALAAYGDHGVPLVGPYDESWALGVLASDVVAHAARAWAANLKQDIQPSSFIIPHLVFNSETTAADIIKQACRFELLDWWVDEGPTIRLARRESHGNYWRARVWPSKLTQTGPQIDRLWNGVIVQYTDVVGNTRSVGPPGSGCYVEDARLLDADPLNPCNQTSPPMKKWQGLQMNTSTPTQAIQVGAAFLTEQKALDQSGEAQLSGWVEDLNGVEWPAWRVRGGDSISFVDAGDNSYRKVVHSDWDDANKTNTVQLDQPPDALQALLERLSVVVVPLGFT